MVLGILKKSKEKEKKEEEIDFLKDLEGIKSNFLEESPELGQKENLEPLSFEPIKPLQLSKEEEKPKLVEEQSKKEVRAITEKESPEIYVKLDNYKKVLDLLEKLKVKLKEIENIVNEVKNIKEGEVNKLEEIKQRLEQSKESIGEVLENLK